MNYIVYNTFVLKTNVRDIYDATDAVKAHPLEDPEKFWLKQSILN